MDSVFATLQSSSQLTLKDILTSDALPSDLAAAELSVAPDASFVETASGPAAREIKRHFDQLYGVGLSVRSPYAITAFVNQHGKQMFRVGNRDLSAPAAAAQEAETRLSEAQVLAKSNDPSSPPRSKRRSRLSMHHIFSPNVFSKPVPAATPTSLASPTSLVTTLSRPETASSTASGHRKLRKTRSFGPGDQPTYQDQHFAYHQQGSAAQPGAASSSSTFVGRAHSQSVTSADASRFTSLASLAAPSSQFAYSSTATFASASTDPSASSGSSHVALSGPASILNPAVMMGAVPGGDHLSQPVPQLSLLLQQASMSQSRQSLPTGDVFAQVMKWGTPTSSSGRQSYANPSTMSFSTTSSTHASGGNSSGGCERSMISASGSSLDQRNRAFLQQPFGAGVVFDSPVRRSLPPRNKRTEGDSSSGQSSQDGSPVNEESVLTPRTAGGATTPQGNSEMLSDHLHFPHWPGLGPVKILREMQSFESTMTARQIDIESSTAGQTPVTAFSQSPWHRRYTDLVDRYSDDGNLRRPPSAVLLRNIVPMPLSEANEADSSDLGESIASKVQTGNFLGENDAEPDMAMESHPSTPIAVIIAHPDDATSPETDAIAHSEAIGVGDSSGQYLSPSMFIRAEPQDSITSGAATKTGDHIPDHTVTPHLESAPGSLTDTGLGSQAVDVPTVQSDQGAVDNNDTRPASRYTSSQDVFDILQTYTGLPLLDRLPAGSGKKAKKAIDPGGATSGSSAVTSEDGGEEEDGDDDDMMMETTVIRMSLTTKEETAAPRDDPRFVIWGWVHDGAKGKDKDAESQRKERKRKTKSWRGSWVSGGEDDSQSDHFGTDSGKGSRKSRPSLGSKKRSKRDKKEEKGKERAMINEFGVASGREDDTNESQDGESADNMPQDTSLGGKKKVLIAATIERWVAQLTSEIDYDELLNFFLTYRIYVSATDLCRVLIGRFYWTLRGDEVPNAKNGKICDERVRRIVRVRTFVAIRYWVLTFWMVDFVPNRELRLLLADCLNQLNKDPLLKKHMDGLGIVRRLIRVAKECRRAHIGSALGRPSQGFQTPEVSPAMPRCEPDDSDVDLDFLPDDQAAPRYGYGYGYPNKPGRTSELLSSGVMPPGFAMGPLTTLGRVADGASHAAGGGPSPFEAPHLRADPHNNQGPLSRVVRTIGKLKRALNARTASTYVAPAPGDNTLGAPHPITEPEVSAFEVDMSGEGASPSIRAGVEGFSAPAKSGRAESIGLPKQVGTIVIPATGGSTAPQVLPHVLPPLALPPLSLPITSPELRRLPGVDTKPQRPIQDENVSESEHSESATEHNNDPASIATAVAASSGNLVSASPLADSSDANVDTTEDIDGSRDSPNTAQGKPLEREENDEAVDSGVEIGTTADVEDYSDPAADTELDSSRAESLRSSSTNSFGVPLTASRGPPPLFSNAQSPWRFDIVSIDDLDLSDTSSDKGPSAPPGLRKPARKLPKKPVFWPRESVSSMGIISHASIVSGPSSSGMSSPAAGLGGRIEPWQLQDLLKSVRADEEEEGGVDAALKRLEGYIDPEKQEEKIKNVNEWITSIQKRIETGDYNVDAEDPRISYPAYDEELIQFNEEKTSHRGSTNGSESSTPPDTAPESTTESEPDSSTSQILRTPDRPTVAAPVLQQTSPLISMGSPRVLDAKSVSEEAIPFEVLQSRMPLFPPPPPAISTFNSHPMPRLRQSFIIPYRAEILAQHFAMIDRELFMSIRFEELVTREWIACQEVNVHDWNQYLKDRARWKTEERFPEKTTALAAVRARFNLMTNFVISEVILTPPSARHLVFKKFLTIAYKSFLMHNFHALTAIVTGLSSDLVYKALGRHWSRIGRREHRMFNDFLQFISSVDEFKYMRNMIDGITQAKLPDDSSHAASIGSGATDSKHKSEAKPNIPPSCIPFIGVYLSQLHRLSQLPDLIDPTSPNLTIAVDPDTGAFDPPRYPDVFSTLAPLPSFIELEPLINVHKQRQVAIVIKSLVAGQHLASCVQFDIDKKLFQKCLRLRASDISTLQQVVVMYPE